VQTTSFALTAYYMKKTLYIRWSLSVHHVPNSQTFARKHSIINLLRSCLSKPSPHSGLIPFIFTNFKKTKNCINKQSTIQLIQTPTYSPQKLPDHSRPAAYIPSPLLHPTNSSILSLAVQCY
jgi:hypothetical protein